MKYSSTCSCGNIKISVNLSSPIEEYRPRKCDCDFCMEHDLSYLSDVNGTLEFYPKAKMNVLRQGSQQASFWQCQSCKQVVAVTNTNNGVTRGAVSTTVFDKLHSLQPPITVSPKLLSTTQKYERWPKIWFKVILR